MGTPTCLNWEIMDVDNFLNCKELQSLIVGAQQDALL